MTPGIRGAGGRFIGKERAPRVTPGRKVCARCHELKDASAFGVDNKSPDRLYSWCKPCKAANQRERYRTKELEAARSPALNRFNRDTLLLKLQKLALIAAEARSLGMWRGRQAIRAYRDLGAVLDEIHLLTPERPEAMDPKAAPCTCPSWPCPRHTPECQPENVHIPAKRTRVA